MMSTAQTSFDASSSQSQLDFLRMAAGDDRFRAELQTNPQAALTRFGFDVEGLDLPAQIDLPEKNEVLKATESDSLDESLAWWGFISLD